MEAGLSELIDTPLTTLGGGEKSRTEGFVGSSEDIKEVIETSLRKVETKKKREMKRNQKLSEELKRARKENEDLQNKLNELNKQKNNEVITTEYRTVASLIILFFFLLSHKREHVFFCSFFFFNNLCSGSGHRVAAVRMLIAVDQLLHIN